MIDEGAKAAAEISSPQRHEGHEEQMRDEG
jgi:hypothetical protein